MSRFNPHHSTAKIYEAAQAWCDQCLLQERSLFAADEALWSSRNLNELDRYFVQNLDAGAGDFLSKLQVQLAMASPGSQKLMAELNWILLLFPSRITPSTKRQTVATIWRWSGAELESANELLSDEILQGIGHAGVAFNTLRWKEVVAFIQALVAWKALEPDRQRELLAEPWEFQKWLGDQPGMQARALFQILPHLLFPDTFERISSRGDKTSILVAFTEVPRREWNRKSQSEIDQALLDLRVKLEDKEGEPIDFYWPPVKEVWRPVSEAEESGPSDDLSEQGREFATALEAFLAAYGEARNGPFTTVGAVSRSMIALRTWLESSPAVASRPTIQVKLSVGQGNWTRTPWLALLDERVTTSTQRGFYIVFLVSDDLSVTYLTLNQGMTELVAGLGQRGAIKAMQDFADGARSQVGVGLGDAFELSSSIDLQSQTSASSNYEAGTVAHKAYFTGSLPTDRAVNGDLELLLSAYDDLIESRANVANAPTNRPQHFYQIEDALEDLFLGGEELSELLDVWQSKTNLILQGAPGVGKSFVARRLAYCLMGEKAPERVRTVQFHQSYSYEDFVRGFRPTSDGGFTLQDGIFFDFCKQAASDPTRRYVLIIDEINRGNLSKILGELMLLVEADKREVASSGAKSWTARLAYSHPDEDEFFVPENLFVLGMMNTADRSLSLVDYALRRRFAFADLKPQFGSTGFRSTLSSFGVPDDGITRVATLMVELNEEIAADRANLGPGFCIGHSFFVPRAQVADVTAWYNRIVRTEIVPLLQEYWFDDPDRVDFWKEKLLAK